MHCIICHDDVAAHKMATTPCAAQHGKVTCKACLLKWFEHKLACPLCAAALQVKCCLRKRDVHARYKLRLARQVVKEEQRREAAEHDARVARELHREELLRAYFDM